MKYLYAYNPETCCVMYRFSENTIYTHMQKLNDNLICVEADESINPERIYLKDGVVKLRGERPSLYYMWSASEESWVLDLGALKSEKRAEIAKSLKTAIRGGYISNGLLYPSDLTDQLNMTASVMDSLNPTNDQNWTTQFWCADEFGTWEFRNLTASQIQKAGSDCRLHITKCLTKNSELKALIEAATTEEELATITW